MRHNGPAAPASHAPTHQHPLLLREGPTHGSAAAHGAKHGCKAVAAAGRNRRQPCAPSASAAVAAATCACAAVNSELAVKPPSSRQQPRPQGAHLHSEADYMLCRPWWSVCQ